MGPYEKFPHSQVLPQFLVNRLKIISVILLYLPYPFNKLDHGARNWRLQISYQESNKKIFIRMQEHMRLIRISQFIMKITRYLLEKMKLSHLIKMALLKHNIHYQMKCTIFLVLHSSFVCRILG